MLIIARPVLNFLASARVGAGLPIDVINPRPSNASFSRLAPSRCGSLPVCERGLIDWPEGFRSKAGVPLVFGGGVGRLELGLGAFQSLSAKSFSKPLFREGSSPFFPSEPETFQAPSKSALALSRAFACADMAFHAASSLSSQFEFALELAGAVLGGIAVDVVWGLWCLEEDPGSRKLSGRPLRIGAIASNTFSLA